MNVRSRALLDLAHELHECQNCGRYVVAGCEPGMRTALRRAKGQGIKAMDNRHAALCHACHRWLDSGTGKDPSGLYDGTRADKKAMWTRAHLRTFDMYWAQSWLEVSA